MDRTEFDKFAEEYYALHRANLGLSGEAPDYFAEYKIKDLRRLIDGAAPSIECGCFLDFGAGVGMSVPFFHQYFPGADLTCVDVSVASLEIGRVRCSGAANFVVFDGVSLPFADATFDGAFATCVFHHIPPSEHRRLFEELRRVLRSNGHVMIYEHNPLNPLTVRTVKACSFDQNAILIGAHAIRSALASAGFQQPRIRYRVFFPRMLRWLRPIERSLGWLPFGAQYYVHARR